MKRSRFSEERIISILKDQEAGMATADVCRRHGISSATCAWQRGTARYHPNAKLEVIAALAAEEEHLPAVWLYREQWPHQGGQPIKAEAHADRKRCS